MSETEDAGQKNPCTEQEVSALPEDIRKELLRLAKEGSADELQRLESVLRIISELREASLIAEQAKIDLDHRLLQQSKEKLQKLEQERQNYVTGWAEGLKLQHDSYKNLSVLDSGALVAFAVVTSNLIDSPIYQALLSVAYSSILVSLLSTLVMMFVVADRVTEILLADKRELGRTWRLIIRLADTLSFLSFAIGLSFFLLFLGFNL